MRWKKKPLNRQRKINLKAHFAWAVLGVETQHLKLSSSLIKVQVGSKKASTTRVDSNVIHPLRPMGRRPR
jgi:hypothetical protein